ncbi:VOC family protein [Nocardiopsis trehalosi]|uniref:VOC family protein n=1 Tax=Nocardiopsis trehalosi TaxID=109329 RepID=UPI000830D097|nr:VOC family protein [Nocardiopsis trehalosi]
MNWTLEVVAVPVADVDRAKEFYADRIGFHIDHDTATIGGPRFVQATPPGSGCSIVFGPAITGMAPGSLQGLQLVVADLRAAHALLRERGVEVGGIQVYGAEGPRPVRDGDDLDNVGFVHFTDPDGNGWAVQQISARADSGPA